MYGEQSIAPGILCPANAVTLPGTLCQACYCSS